MSEVVHVGSGKVRELYAIDDERLLLTASDRISVFDVVLPTEIPDKGRVLTGLSGFWFERTKDIVPNHLLAIRDDGRSMECKRLQMLPIECVVRGYLSGSGWKSYRERGEVCGIPLPEGLAESDKLPEPIFTPTTKATEGHDEALTPRAGGRTRRAGAVRRAEPDLDPALQDRGRGRRGQGDHHRRHEVRAGCRRGGPDRPGRRDLHARLVALLAGRRVHARGARRRRSTSSSCATTPSRSAGTRHRPGPSCRRTSSRGRVRATSRHSSRSPGSRSTTTPPTRHGC